MPFNCLIHSESAEGVPVPGRCASSIQQLAIFFTHKLKPDSCVQMFARDWGNGSVIKELATEVRRTKFRSLASM